MGDAAPILPDWKFSRGGNSGHITMGFEHFVSEHTGSIFSFIAVGLGIPIFAVVVFGGFWKSMAGVGRYFLVLQGVICLVSWYAFYIYSISLLETLYATLMFVIAIALVLTSETYRKT